MQIICNENANHATLFLTLCKLRPLHNSLFETLEKRPIPVTPAKAGVHNPIESLDSRFRGNDRSGMKADIFKGLILLIIDSKFWGSGLKI